MHTELWTANEIGPDGEPVPEEFLCTFDEEVGTDLWLEYFTLYSADYSMEQVVPLEARWEHVEVTSGGRNGKGKGKPATELIYDASFRIDLDGDGTPETPEAAVDVRAELASSRGAQITYYYE